MKYLLPNRNKLFVKKNGAIDSEQDPEGHWIYDPQMVIDVRKYQDKSQDNKPVELTTSSAESK